MEHEKLHALVNDLLPNYIDHLTSPESDKLIEDHLAHCPRCQKSLERMREEQESAMEDAIEVDYLKKVRKKGRRNVIVAVCVALLAVSAITGVWVFGWGTKADPATLGYTVDVKLDDVVLQVASDVEGRKVSRVAWSENDGRVRAEVYTVPGTQQAPETVVYTANGGVAKVDVGGWTAWENNQAISSELAALYARRVEYVGDVSGVSRLLETMRVSNWIGGYTMELDDTRLIVEGERMMNEAYTKQNALLLLSLIANASALTWQSGDQEQTITAEQLSEEVGRDIKEGYHSVAVLQQNLDRLDEEGHAWQTYYLDLTLEDDFSKDEVVTIEVWRDGKMVASQSARVRDWLQGANRLEQAFWLEKGDYTWTITLDGHQSGPMPLEPHTRYIAAAGQWKKEGEEQ